MVLDRLRSEIRGAGIQLYVQRKPRAEMNPAYHATGGSFKIGFMPKSAFISCVLVDDWPGDEAVHAKFVCLALAHELGHYIHHYSDQLPCYTKDMLANPVWKFYVMKCEHRAWVHAYALLKSMGWTDWGMFNRVAEHCLDSYRRHE